MLTLRPFADYCTKLGVFDEKMIGRDRTPDKSVNGLAKGITGELRSEVVHYSAELTRAIYSLHVRPHGHGFLHALQQEHHAID